MKFLVTQFSSALLLSVLDPNAFLNTLFSNNFNLVYFLPSIWETTFHNHTKQRTKLWLCICNLYVLYKKGAKIIGLVVADIHVFHICSSKFWEHKQIYGYKLLRAVRIAFSILSGEVRIFYGRNQLSSEITDTVTLSAHVLYSYLRSVYNAQYDVFGDKNARWQSPCVTIFVPWEEIQAKKTQA